MVVTVTTADSMRAYTAVNNSGLFIYNIPFRGIAKMTGGKASMEMAEGLVDMVNGHFLKGFGKVVGGFFANARKNRKYEKKLVH